MLIGITGAAGAGKDTFANMLAGELRDRGEWVVRDSFASSLKQSAAAAIATTPKVLEQFKRDGVMGITLSRPGGRTGTITLTVREYLQRYGTEAHRDIFGSEFWVEDLLRRHRSVSSQHVRIVSDCRFQNEAEAIVRGGGRIYFVTRPEDDGIGVAHPSEDFSWAVDPASPVHGSVIHVGNLGTLDDLLASAREHARSIALPV